METARSRRIANNLPRVVMPHGTTSMSGEKGPAKRLRRVIRRVDDARDVPHVQNTSLTPLLNGKMLNIDVARTWGRLALVDHSDSSLVIFVQRSGTILRKAKVCQDRTKVLGSLARMDGSNKLGLG